MLKWVHRPKETPIDRQTEAGMAPPPKRLPFPGSRGSMPPTFRKRRAEQPLTFDRSAGSGMHGIGTERR